MKKYLRNYKNFLLLLTPVISHLYTLFRGDKTRVDWWLFLDDFTRRIDIAVLYFSIAINFVILSYCFHYPNGVSKKVTRFTYLMCILDFLHLWFFSKLHFGIAKLFLAIIIYFIYEKIKQWRRYHSKPS